MSIQTQISRISGAVQAALAALTKKGVTVPNGTKVDGLASLIEGISTGTDTSDATAAAGDILSGKTAYAKGAKVTGTIATKTASNMTANGATVTAPAGYYASAQSKSVATATQATPSISVDSAGKITASATQSAGYVSAGTKTGTKQLTTQAAKTVTPSTSNQTAVASGVYTTGAVTVKGDANLIAENIKSGVSIFGVNGSFEGSGGGSVETCTVSFLYWDDCVVGVWYSDGLQLRFIDEMQLMDEYMGRVEIEVAKNTILEIFTYDESPIVNNIEGGVTPIDHPYGYHIDRHLSFAITDAGYFSVELNYG